MICQVSKSTPRNHVSGIMFSYKSHDAILKLVKFTNCYNVFTSLFRKSKSYEKHTIIKRQPTASQNDPKLKTSTLRWTMNKFTSKTKEMKDFNSTSRNRGTSLGPPQTLPDPPAIPKGFPRTPEDPSETLHIINFPKK